MKVAVVSEGVNDYLALKEIFCAVAAKKGVFLTAFDAVQPRVDATSSTQVGGGGWTLVRAWLQNNSRERCREFFTPQLFSSSISYDLLLVHLDGDVVWLSHEFSALERAACFQHPENIARHIERYIERLLQPPDDLDDKVLYAVPVMHMESWLSAAMVKQPFRIPIEYRSIKGAGQRYLSWRTGLPAKAAMQSAASLVADKLDALCSDLGSLDRFVKKLDTAL